MISGGMVYDHSNDKYKTWIIAIGRYKTFFGKTF